MWGSKVVDVDLQMQLYAHRKPLTPLPSIHLPEAIAENQAGVADNVLACTKSEWVHQVSEQTRGHHFFLINLTFVATEAVNFYDMHVGVFPVGSFSDGFERGGNRFWAEEFKLVNRFCSSSGVNRFCSPG